MKFQFYHGNEVGFFSHPNLKERHPIPTQLGWIHVLLVGTWSVCGIQTSDSTENLILYRLCQSETMKSVSFPPLSKTGLLAG